MNASDILSRMIDEGSWNAAAEVAHWQQRNNEATPHPEIAARATVLHRGRVEVVMALCLGMLKRAHVKDDNSIGTRAHDYVCVHDDATILPTRDAAVCAALAIWLACNPCPTS